MIHILSSTSILFWQCDRTEIDMKTFLKDENWMLLYKMIPKNQFTGSLIFAKCLKVFLMFEVFRINKTSYYCLALSLAWGRLSGPPMLVFASFRG